MGRNLDKAISALKSIKEKNSDEIFVKSDLSSIPASGELTKIILDNSNISIKLKSN